MCIFCLCGLISRTARKACGIRCAFASAVATSRVLGALCSEICFIEQMISNIRIRDILHDDMFHAETGLARSLATTFHRPPRETLHAACALCGHRSCPPHVSHPSRLARRLDAPPLSQCPHWWLPAVAAAATHTRTHTSLTRSTRTASAPTLLLSALCSLSRGRFR